MSSICTMNGLCSEICGEASYRGKRLTLAERGRNGRFKNKWWWYLWFIAESTLKLHYNIGAHTVLRPLTTVNWHLIGFTNNRINRRRICRSTQSRFIAGRLRLEQTRHVSRSVRQKVARSAVECRHLHRAEPPDDAEDRRHSLLGARFAILPSREARRNPTAEQRRGAHLTSWTGYLVFMFVINFVFVTNFQARMREQCIYRACMGRLRLDVIYGSHTWRKSIILRPDMEE